jgi:hypothetical protein
VGHVGVKVDVGGGDLFMARRTVEAIVPEAIGPRGALPFKNSSRRSLTGRPRRR